jgi:hypothetical protein
MFMAKSPSRKQSRYSNTEQNNGFGKGTDLLRYDQQFWIITIALCRESDRHHRFSASEGKSVLSRIRCSVLLHLQPQRRQCRRHIHAGLIMDRC